MDRDPRALASLARDLAMNVKKRADVFRAFELTEEEYQEIEQIDFYRRCYEACIIEWSRPLSTDERIRLSARAIMEDALPVVGGRMQNPNEPLTSVVEAGKFLARAGGVDDAARQAAANPVEKFVITIDLGAGRLERYEKELTLEPTKDVEIKTISTPD